SSPLQFIPTCADLGCGIDSRKIAALKSAHRGVRLCFPTPQSYDRRVQIIADAKSPFRHFQFFGHLYLPSSLLISPEPRARAPACCHALDQVLRAHPLDRGPVGRVRQATSSYVCLGLLSGRRFGTLPIRAKNIIPAFLRRRLSRPDTQANRSKTCHPKRHDNIYSVALFLFRNAPSPAALDCDRLREGATNSIV